MSAEAQSGEAQTTGFQGQIPSIEPLITEVIATLALAAHAYLSDEDGRSPDISGAELALDVATAAFERVKGRLGAQERLAAAQMLTETRMAFVKKRGL